MREQTDSHSLGEATSSIQSKKDGLGKKKAISKDVPNILSLQHPEKAAKKLSKEERAKIQKQKNREAAQRSRDIHKEYVTSLEQEVRTLREKVEHSLRYCHRCQQLMTLEQTLPQNQDFVVVLQGSELQNELPSQYPANQEQIQPDSFLRWLEPQEEVPLMKIMLLVCMIATAVMVGVNNQTVSNSRSLAEKYEEPILQPTKVDVASKPAVQQFTAEQRGLVHLDRGIQNQKCLDSLMKLQGPAQRKSLRSIHESINSQEISNIMLCSLKTPKVYQIKQDLSDFPMVRLFVSGSDIKKMAEGSETMLKMTHRNIQLNGIYRLAAEIKSVQLLQHQSCIL